MPLSHLKVLDLTLARAGPTARRQFADWGANVIRIGPPFAGDSLTGDGEDDPDFQNLHRNKRAIALDLKHPDGHALFMELARDVLQHALNVRVDLPL